LHCPSKTSLKSENNGTILWWQFHNYCNFFLRPPNFCCWTHTCKSYYR
jgi:hypothetical protein